MAAKKNAIAAAKLAIETCNSAEQSLKSIDASNAPTLDTPLAVIQKDMRAILSMLYFSTTKLSLAMSQQEYSAALSPLKDITVQIPTLMHCISLFDGDLVGKTLAQEVRMVAIDVIVSTAALLQSFVKGEGPATASKEYLFRTGSVHEIIDAARGAKGISDNNTVAVKKKWAANQAPMEDGIKELAESIEKAKSESPAEEETEDDFDDGWDELGISSDDKMDADELVRAEKGHVVLRLCSMLHKRVARDLLTITPASSVDNTLLDSLPTFSANLLSHADDLIMSFEAPQEKSQILECLDGLVEQIHDLRGTLKPLLLEPVSAGLGKPISAGPTEPDGDTAKNDAPKTDKPSPTKWFETCFVQIDKGADALRALLQEQSNAS
ncbi:hypothetical protein BD626DRAFT_573426 [Schizophyllum amplum]|uniref:Cyclin-D1-binding protein 1-like N-terminal domain-containing protein n=1 Tax=Schizophyllum amplum TaxID=97359 RepID=A0A550C1H9_9AGAR|nr:hypothetical protein BD626DRAFT_573426 [Auriculariopsis ampla]